MKGYRTLVLNYLVLVGSAIPILIEIVNEMLSDPAITALIPSQVAPLLFAGLAIANIIMRHITTTPVGRSG